jgi:hypothetical protein
MVGEMAGRDVNRLSDAGTRCLNAGKSNGFQENLLDQKTDRNRKATIRTCG